MPEPLWWGLYFVISIWAQELSGGLDFLSPGLLVCLQTGQFWTAAWMTFLWVFVQEGVGNLVFGVAIVFYAGMYLTFLLSRWLLEPENPLFIFVFSFILSAWAWVTLSGAVRFQELEILMLSPWIWIPRQWAAYVIYWALALALFRRLVAYGRF